jgi:Mg2+/Co2+ transporter CorB
MDNITVEIGIMLVLLVFSAMFSASETALTSVSRARVFALIQDGVSRARLVLYLKDKKDALISTILLGNTMVNSALATLITIVSIRFYGEEMGAWVATGIISVVLLIFSEVLPKSVAIHHPERSSLILAPILHFSMQVLWPLTRLVQLIVRSILRVFGVNLQTSKALISAQDVIRGTIEMHHSEGKVEKEDRDMLGSILDLNDREVHEVMVHRKQVVSIDLGLDPEMIISQTIASGHSRLPLWKDEMENIIGILHVKDLLKLVRAQKIGITREMIRRIAQKPWFVPETTKLADQLSAFREKRKHFACVVDEYGAWQGILTLEDIIEEIVGEIDDEHDPLEMSEIVAVSERAYRAEGTVTVRDINRQLDWDLPDEYANTIAGLVLHIARVIPDKGAIFEAFGYRFTVEERKANQITRLIVEKLHSAADDFDDAQE